MGPTRDAAIKSQILKKRRRSKSKKGGEPGAKKRKTGEKSSRKVTDLKPFDQKDIEMIQKILGNFIGYNFATESHFLYNSLTKKNSEFAQFPVVTGEPENKGTLPADKYFLGCDSIPVIEFVLRTVYYLHYGGDSTIKPHEKWSLYKWNQMYYGTKAFASKITSTILSDMLAKTRPYGGSELPPYPNIAETYCYKTVKPYLVSIKDYFEAFPDRIPADLAFAPLKAMPFSHLESINAEIKKKKSDLLLEESIDKVADVPSDDESVGTDDSEESSSADEE